MDGDRAFSVIAHPDQWARCSHTSTDLLDGGGIALTWDDAAPDPMGAPSSDCGSQTVREAAGLGFDGWCRAYRARPSVGRVEVQGSDAAGLDSLGGSPSQFGTPRPGPLRTPRGLAVDGQQRLYVAEAGAGAVHVVDLWSQRLLRRLQLRSRRQSRRRPVDVAATCCGAVVLTEEPVAVLRIDGRRGALPGPAVVRPAGAGSRRPTRIATQDGGVLLLWPGTDPARPGSGSSAGARATASARATAGAGSAAGAAPEAVIARPDGTVLLAVAGATDVDVGLDGVLVVARAPGQSFRRFRDTGGGDWAEVEPLGARDYDGGAIAVAPDGRVGFTTEYGFAWTSGAQVGYAEAGAMVSYRLDAGAYRARWGRVFLDACVPPGTGVSLQFLTTDDDDVPTDPVPASSPVRGGRRVPFPDQTPPLPSRTALAAQPKTQPLYRRVSGREWPWAQIDADDRFETYETPVNAPPGRYLWLVLRMTGTNRATPRVREIRIERPGHRLLNQLPRAWSRDEADAGFLQRYLAPAEGLLHELDERAATRDVLLDPGAVPQEAVAWLAGLVGLVLDRRWPERSRRMLLAEAFSLFRLRGTQACLERILSIYLDRGVLAIENWRLRGLGGAVLGTAAVGRPAPAVGGAAAASGALGRFSLGGVLPGQDGYTATAHRFTVLVPGDLTTEQREVVAAVVEQHKPAHTLAEICELGGGMRVGRRLHVSLTSFVGPGAGWGPAVVGQVLVGGDGVVGLPAVGARLGETSGVGAVRVG